MTTVVSKLPWKKNVLSFALEAACDHAAKAADVAEDLLDDFFYNGDDEDMISQNVIVAFPVPPSGMGRGQGATLPSWMPNN